MEDMTPLASELSFPATFVTPCRNPSFMSSKLSKGLKCAFVFPELEIEYDEKILMEI